MKRLRNVIWLSAALLLSGVFSCTTQEEMPETGVGSVAITFSTGLQTRAVTPGDGAVADGGGIYVDGSGNPDIHVFIFDGSDNIAARYLAADATFNSVPAGCFSYTATTATILFTDMPQGDYSVYAVANTEGTGKWLSVDWTSIATVSDLENIVFPALALGTAPVMTSGRLPLSASGTLSVSSRHTGEVNLEMLRCTGKVSVQLIDQTDNGLSISNLSVTLHGINATKGYLFAHSPDTPAGTEYGDISISDATGTDERVIFTNKLAEYPNYVFPQANGPYTCDISFTVHTTEAGTPVTSDKSFTGLPVQNFRAENIMSIARNQHLIVQIRISEGHMVSFNFIVGDWTNLNESVEFD